MQNFLNEHVLQLEMRTVQVMEIWEKRILNPCRWDVWKPVVGFLKLDSHPPTCNGVYPHAPAHTPLYKHLHKLTHRLTCTHVHHTYKQTHLQKHTPPYTHMHIPVQAPHIHADTPTHIHTHTHACAHHDLASQGYFTTRHRVFT